MGVEIDGGWGVDEDGVVLASRSGKNEKGLEESFRGGATGSVGLAGCGNKIEVVLLGIEEVVKRNGVTSASFGFEEALSVALLFES